MRLVGIHLIHRCMILSPAFIHRGLLMCRSAVLTPKAIGFCTFWVLWRFTFLDPVAAPMPNEWDDGHGIGLVPWWGTTGEEPAYSLPPPRVFELRAARESPAHSFISASYTVGHVVQGSIVRCCPKNLRLAYSCLTELLAQ